MSNIIHLPVRLRRYNKTKFKRRTIFIKIRRRKLRKAA
jgi:hypothetical protein